MNVLSLFDGMSCGQIALSKLGVTPENYFASEIDRHAIKVTQANYPNTIQLGDVTKIDVDALPKIDLLIGGSPCQGFSVAGKGLNFDDPRSKLFFDFVRIKNKLQEKNPELFFLLENVKMKKQWLNIISEHMGVEPIFINSALVSAQNRQRYYWTNIPNVKQPADKGVLIAHILEPSENVDEKYILKGNYKEWFDKNFEKLRKKTMIALDGDKSIPHLARTYASWRGNFVSVTSKGIIQINPSRESQGRQPFQQNRLYCKDGISPAIQTGSIPNILDENYLVRKYTHIEVERLQTVPDNYTNHVSDSQRYKMLGNGWTVDVIVHILGHLPSSIL